MCSVNCTLKDSKNGGFHVRHNTIKTEQNQSKENKNARLTVAQTPPASVSVIHFQAFTLNSLSCDRWLKSHSAGRPSAQTWESLGQHDQLAPNQKPPSLGSLCLSSCCDVFLVQYTGYDN